MLFNSTQLQGFMKAIGHCIYLHLQVKREANLSKVKDRLTRYEQWKTHGRKGGRRHILGFGSRTPREVCFTLDARRSSSQSTLRRSPNSSDYDSYFNRRAVSASSVVRRHCCIDINKLMQGTGMFFILSLSYNMSIIYIVKQETIEHVKIQFVENDLSLLESTC